MKVRFWGCRGSLPTPGPDTLRYGGNSTCLEIRSKNDGLIVVDAGSGIRKLGKAILKDQGVEDFCLMLTHSHWDHLMGFPFFLPGYFSKYSIRVCGGTDAQTSLKASLEHQMQPPYFPVDLTAMNAAFCFDCHTPGAECHRSLDIYAIPLNHPNGGYGFKFTEDGKTFVFLTDNEIDFQHDGGLTREAYVDVCRGADLLVHDAQYDDEGYERTRGWGHSTYRQAVDLALEAGVKELGLFHHDPDRRDSDLDRIHEACLELIAEAGGALHCFVVAEGTTHEL